MRIWHRDILSVLPKDFLVRLMRECVNIKRKLEQGRRLPAEVRYIEKYKKEYLLDYAMNVSHLLDIAQGKNTLKKQFDEIYEFCIDEIDPNAPYQKLIYPEHNERFLIQCYYDLQHKYDRGIISEDDWEYIKKFILDIQQVKYKK